LNEPALSLNEPALSLNEPALSLNEIDGDIRPMLNLLQRLGDQC